MRRAFGWATAHRDVGRCTASGAGAGRSRRHRGPVWNSFRADLPGGRVVRQLTEPGHACQRDGVTRPSPPSLSRLLGTAERCFTRSTSVCALSASSPTSTGGSLSLERTNMPAARASSRTAKCAGPASQNGWKSRRDPCAQPRGRAAGSSPGSWRLRPIPLLVGVGGVSSRRQGALSGGTRRRGFRPRRVARF